MTHDLLQLFLRKAGLFGGCSHCVALLRMRLAKRCNCLLDLFGTESDLGGKVLDGRVVGDLAEIAVQKTHRVSPQLWLHANQAPRASQTAVRIMGIRKQVKSRSPQSAASPLVKDR